MIFYLIRHAHAEWQPDEQRPLSLQGERDALRVAETLADRPVRAAISSPYRRAIQTIAPLADTLDLEIQIDDRFRERALGNWSTVSFDEAVRLTWQDMTFRHDGGESNQAAQERAIAALMDLVAGDSTNHCAIASHGNLVALTLNAFDPEIDFGFWAQLTMPDIYQVEVRRGKGATYRRIWTADD
jgi:2,3-bisphosphoglycerate-dependent phosphoglycerate mutase